MFCNEWQGCQRSTASSSPGSWQEGSRQLPTLPRHHERETQPGRDLLAPGGAFGQKGRGGAGLEKSHLEAVWKFSLEWEC